MAALSRRIGAPAARLMALVAALAALTAGAAVPVALAKGGMLPPHARAGLEICGKRIAPLGTPVLSRFERPGRFELDVHARTDGPIAAVLMLSPSCGKGFAVRLEPRNKLHLFTSVEGPGPGHRMVAIVIDAVEAGTGWIFVAHPGHRRTVIVVRIRPPGPPCCKRLEPA